MVKLSTGREVEVKALTLDQRLEVDDAMNIFMSNMAKPTISYSVALKGIRYSCKDVPDDLSNLEIVELYNNIFEISHLDATEKKS